MNKNVVFTLIALAGLTVVPWVHAAEADVKGSTELRSFFQGYLAESKGEVPSLKVPAVWLFSPEGQLVARVDDPQGVAALSDTLGKPATSISAVDLSRIVGILDKQGVQVPAAAPEQWTALLISRAPCVEVCQTFHKEVDELHKKQAVRLRVVDLSLTL